MELAIRRSQCQAHDVTTIFEGPIPDDELASAPCEGQVGQTLAFLAKLGLEQVATDTHPGRGRSWLFRHGCPDDPDYWEREVFASFSASWPPVTPGDRPRVGDAVFRLPDRNPAETLARLRGAGLLRPYLGQEGPLFLGPDDVAYELVAVSADRAANRRISVWTDPDQLGDVATDLETCFGFSTIGHDRDFHGVARALVLRRDQPAVTLQLLVPAAPGGTLSPRWRDNPLDQVGFATIRLGTTHRDKVLEVGHEVGVAGLPGAGVRFHHLFLDVVDLGTDSPPAPRG